MEKYYPRIKDGIDCAEFQLSLFVAMRLMYWPEKTKAPIKIGAYLPKPTTVTLLLQQYFYVENCSVSALQTDPV